MDNSFKPYQLCEIFNNLIIPIPEPYFNTDAISIFTPLNITPTSQSKHTNELFNHWRSIEQQIDYKSNCMDKNTNLSEKMFNILTNWIYDVCKKFKCSPQTIFLTSQLIRSYLLKTPTVKRSRLQLVGLSCLLISSKIEDIYPPEISECIYACDKAYTRMELLEMELDILKTINFETLVPTTIHFINIFLTDDKTFNKKMVALAIMYAFESNKHVDILTYKPSMIAAAIYYLVKKKHGKMVSKQSFYKTTGCKYNSIVKLMVKLEEKMKDPNSHMFIHPLKTL